MKARSTKLRRLVSVQRQIERIAEIELAELAMERAAISERLDHLVDALASPNPVHSGFSKLYGSQIARLKIKDQMLGGRMRMQEKKLMTERAKADRLEDHARHAGNDERRAGEEEALYDILDRIGDSSLR
ncbi:hypothetical protein [Pararhizobium haloflavum]|uniref:hypothetical protein n=1 Tax=Pararhizobium haloflavum TaxID=2037914 RepID=UPI000C1A0EFB|nr:hypothetical protein [Pararhizobium haloflavum]